MSHDRLETVDDSNWEDFTSSPVAVLLVTNKNCGHCRQWKDELAGFLEQDTEYGTVRFGMVTLDGENVSHFEASNKEWLDIIDGVPFTAIYVGGTPTTSFYGNGVKRLVNRMNKIPEARPLE